MVSEVLVEALHDRDKNAVRNLLVAGYTEYKDTYSDPNHWLEYKESLENSVDNPDVDEILVAKVDGEILGTLQLFTSSTKAYQIEKELAIVAPIIRLLAVSPLARGKGIARALIDASIDYAKIRKANAIYLHTSDRMTQAVRLYEKFGFVRDESKDFQKYDILVKCYRFDLSNESIS